MAMNEIIKKVCLLYDNAFILLFEFRNNRVCLTVQPVIQLRSFSFFFFNFFS